MVGLTKIGMNEEEDQFGLLWQIVFPVWDDTMRDKDAGKSESVMKAILEMTKPDIKTLRQAYDGV